MRVGTIIVMQEDFSMSLCQSNSTQSVGTRVPTRSVGTRKFASASHQLHVGGFRVKRQIDWRLVLTPERHLRFIAGRFVKRPTETHAPDPTRINLVAR